AAFGEERVLRGQRRGRVLVSRQTEPARRAQHRRSGLASGGQVLGRFALGLLRVGLRLRHGHLLALLLGLQPGSGAAAFLAQPATFGGRGDQDRGVQTLLLLHSAGPLPLLVPAVAGGSNQERPRSDDGVWRASGRARRPSRVGGSVLFWAGVRWS